MTINGQQQSAADLLALATGATVKRQLGDPYIDFAAWCRSNGFADVADSERKAVTMNRMDEAITAYVKA